MRYVQIKEDLLEELRERGHTRKLTFTKKDKTKFTGRLKLNGNKLGFDFSSGLLCPSCKKELRMNWGGCFCDCGLKLFRNICGRTLTDRELKKLLAGETLPPTDYTSKSGELFSAGLKLENDKLSFVFEELARFPIRTEWGISIFFFFQLLLKNQYRRK